MLAPLVANACLNRSTSLNDLETGLLCFLLEAVRYRGKEMRFVARREAESGRGFEMATTTLATPQVALPTESGTHHSRSSSSRGNDNSEAQHERIVLFGQASTLGLTQGLRY